MTEAFSRTTLLLGADAMDQLSRAHVAVFGLGGVGSFCAEALARSGIGALDLIDHDVISLSNLNRQLYATLDTIGQAKAAVAASRIAQINPACRVQTHRVFYTPQNSADFDFTQYDYIVDAIDTVTGKLELVRQAAAANTPIISAMGTGNKLDPSLLEIADIQQTCVCPLARIMRRELKKRGIFHLKVVYSREQPLRPAESTAYQNMQHTGRQRDIPGSTAFVPPVAGFLLASEVIRELTGIYGNGPAV